MKAVLGLEDGEFVVGDGFGVEGECCGELVFNTQMTGYMESLTDPSYAGQILMFTFPLIGNYGVNAEDVESYKPHLAGFIVRQRSRRVSNFRSDGELGDYLARNNIVGLEGIDTRALTRHIRLKGAMKAIIWGGEKPPSKDDLVDKARAWSGVVRAWSHNGGRGVGQRGKSCDRVTVRA